jgi:dipeptide/tripeptide permease
MSAGFWTVYEQQGNTTALFADEHVDRGRGLQSSTV